jgi:hypothetical protein
VTLISETTNPAYVAASDESAMRFEELRPINAEVVDDLVGSYPPAWVISNHSQASEFAGYGSDA